MGSSINNNIKTLCSPDPDRIHMKLFAMKLVASPVMPTLYHPNYHLDDIQ